MSKKIGDLGEVGGGSRLKDWGQKVSEEEVVGCVSMQWVEVRKVWI